MFIMDPSVHSGAHWGSSRSSVDAAFIGVGTWGRCFQPGCALRVIGFIWGHWGPPSWSLCSSGVAGFFVVISVSRRVYLRPLGKFGCALVVYSSSRLRFIRVRPGVRLVSSGSLGSLAFAFGFVGFIRGHWVHWCLPWGTSCSSGVIMMRTGDHCVHPGSICSLRCPWGSSGSSWVTWYIGVRPGGRRVHPRSLCSFGCVLAVVRVHWGCALWVSGFIRGHWFNWGAPRGSSRSSGVAGFIGVRPVDLRVLQESLCSLVAPRRVHAGSISSLECSLAVVGFIRDRWVH